MKIINGSPMFSLYREDWKKVGKGALIAVGGAILTYGTQILTNFDFKTYGPIITAVWSILANLGWKWIKNNQNN